MESRGSSIPADPQSSVENSVPCRSPGPAPSVCPCWWGQQDMALDMGDGLGLTELLLGWGETATSTPCSSRAGRQGTNLFSAGSDKKPSSSCSSAKGFWLCKELLCCSWKLMALPATGPGLYLQEKPQAHCEVCSDASWGSVFSIIIPYSPPFSFSIFHPILAVSQ